MRSALSRQDENGEGLQENSAGEFGGLILADEYKELLDGLAYGPKDSIRRIKIYTVKEGDTLESIARQEMDDRKKDEEIAFLNGLDVTDQLHAGQKLKVVVY
jgi:predicted Zn-dependent protease